MTAVVESTVVPHDPSPDPALAPVARPALPRLPGLEEILKDPERGALWLQVFEEEAALRGLPPLAPRV